jgi:PRC-barrel domain
MPNDTMNAPGRIDTDETMQLISSAKVDGTAVYNRNAERLGTIDHLMINKFNGQVAYAVMSFGGFLGIGGSYHPLPWKALTYDPRLGGYLVDTDRSRLEQAPYYGATEPDWSDRGYTGRIDDYWQPVL